MTVKHIVFLDDMEERHKAFRQRAPHGFMYHHVTTAEEAIREIEKWAPAQVFLDHDLSEEDIMVAVGGSSRVPTGMTVVDHIVKMDRPPPSVIVHSCNDPAAEEMVKRLKARPEIHSFRVPFPNLIVSMMMDSSDD